MIEINQYIKRTDLPTWALYPDTYPELNLDLKGGTKYYYEALKKDLEQDHKSPGLAADMAGQSGEGSPYSGDGPGQISGNLHPTWDQFNNLPQAEQDLIKKQVEYQIKEIINNSLKDRSKIPGELKTMIDNLFKIEEPIFDWKGYLRRFVGASTMIYTKKSRRKVNRRFFGLPAIKIKTKNHILVAVDTSGSVSDKELVEFYNEIHHIWKAGVMVTVAQCDADIHNFSEYKGKFDGRVHGRGGTSFQPPVDYFDEHSSKFSTLIFFTDGYAPAPTRPKKHMLWVMSSNSQPLESFKTWPGIKIRINK